MHTLAIVVFSAITVLFVILGSRPILFHLLCAAVLVFFVLSTSILVPETIPEWLVLTTGLLLYWFGLVIVRIMLTRSVSLRMLANYDRRTDLDPFDNAREGIAARLKDMNQFGLVLRDEEGCSLTPFGRLIGWIVAVTYAILRIK